MLLFRPRLSRSCLALVAACLALAACGGPPRPFDPVSTPLQPDYGRDEAWLALPGRNGLERSAPQGLTPVAEASAPADVFFIHPTTTTRRDIWNAAWDATGEAAPLNPPVLMAQLSVFNGCCRLFAPRYRRRCRV